jgi:polar amino acid transport system permease protein
MVRGPTVITPVAQEVWRWEVAWDFLPEIAQGMLFTVLATLIGITIAVVLGLILALLRRSQTRAIRLPTAWFIEFIRSTPLLVQLMFLFPFVLPGSRVPTAAFVTLVIGLAVHYGAYTSESYRAGIESVDRGQWEASIALNLPSVTKWTRVILPQAIPTVIPALGNYLVGMVKDAPLGIAIGATGILTVAFREASTTFRFVEAYGVMGLLFLAVSLPLAFLARYLEKRYGYERI